jgi:hypothetical protein
MDEILGSSASATFVRSTYEIVYMMSATGMMRSQRWDFAEFKLRVVNRTTWRCSMVNF